MYQQLSKGITNKIVITDKELDSVKHFFIPKKIRKRQYLLNAGDVCEYQAFVEKGLLRMFTIDDKAHEHVIQFAMEGWWVSDLYSFLSGENAQYNIEALEDTELLLLNKEGMEGMTKEVPKMERYFRLLMQNSIVALQRKVLSSHSDTAEEKYLRLIETYPSVITRSPQHDVASYLGITPETLSRVRKQLSKK